MIDPTAKPVDIEFIKSGKNVTVVIKGRRSDDPTQMFCKSSQFVIIPKINM